MQGPGRAPGALLSIHTCLLLSLREECKPTRLPNEVQPGRRGYLLYSCRYIAAGAFRLCCIRLDREELFHLNEAGAFGALLDDVWVFITILPFDEWAISIDIEDLRRIADRLLQYQNGMTAPVIKLLYLHRYLLFFACLSLPDHSFLSGVRHESGEESSLNHSSRIKPWFEHTSFSQSNIRRRGRLSKRTGILPASTFSKSYG